MRPASRGGRPRNPRASHLEAEVALVMRALKLPEPLREYQFDPGRRWRFDFAWPSSLVALEVEGGQYVRGPDGQLRGGRHQSLRGLAADCEKYNTACWMGWRVFRIAGSEVRAASTHLLLERVRAMVSTTCEVAP